MKRLLSFGLTAILLSSLVFGVSLAAGYDSASANGSILFNSTASLPTVEIRLNGQEVWSKSNMPLNDSVFDTNSHIEDYHFELRNLKTVTSLNEVPDIYRLEVINYSKDSTFNDEELIVLVSTNPNDLIVEDHLYFGTLKSLRTSPFGISPTIIDSEGQLISQPLTDIYVKIQAAGPVNLDSVIINYTLFFVDNSTPVPFE